VARNSELAHHEHVERNLERLCNLEPHPAGRRAGARAPRRPPCPAVVREQAAEISPGVRAVAEAARVSDSAQPAWLTFPSLEASRCKGLQHASPARDRIKRSLFSIGLQLPRRPIPRPPAPAGPLSALPVQPFATLWPTGISRAWLDPLRTHIPTEIGSKGNLRKLRYRRVAPLRGTASFERARQGRTTLDSERVFRLERKLRITESLEPAP